MPNVHSKDEVDPSAELNQLSQEIRWDSAPGNLKSIEDKLKIVFGPSSVMSLRNLSRQLAIVDGTFVVGEVTLKFYKEIQAAINSARDDQGRGVLHALIEKGDDRACTTRLFLQFLRAGIDMRITDNRGRTAAHYACYKGEWNFCKWLLISRADFIMSKDAEGRTPLDALKHYHEPNGEELSPDAEEVVKMIEAEIPLMSLAELAAEKLLWPALMNVSRRGAIVGEEIEQECLNKTAIGWLIDLKGIKEEAEFRFRYEKK